MKIASLGSGSKGNATLVASPESCVLIDCGFSLRDLEARAERLSFSLADIDAILVTHEHSDHASGVAALARRYDVPVFATHGTVSTGRLDGCPDLRSFNADTDFVVGELHIDAIAVPHDAREPVQYRLSYAGNSIGVLTDLGSVSEHVRRAFNECDFLLLEFNHDRDMLLRGPYPAALKRRVGGDWGHLSNTQAVDLLRSLDLARLQGLVVAHVSEQNNDRSRVEAILKAELPELVPRVLWADQCSGFSWQALVSEYALAAY